MTLTVNGFPFMLLAQPPRESVARQRENYGESLEPLALKALADGPKTSRQIAEAAEKKSGKWQLRSIENALHRLRVQGRVVALSRLRARGHPTIFALAESKPPAAPQAAALDSFSVAWRSKSRGKRGKHFHLDQYCANGGMDALLRSRLGACLVGGFVPCGVCAIPRLQATQPGGVHHPLDAGRLSPPASTLGQVVL